MAQQIKILDTTLRDGQQCPGAGMSFEKNVQYAQLAKEINVDILEAGFPSASQLDFEIVHRIAQDYSQDQQTPILAALCQLREYQVDLTMKALEPALRHNKARLHVYLPVDPQLMKASLGSYADDKKRMIKDIFTLIKKAVDQGLEVEFTPEGYSRLDDQFDFVTETIFAAIEAGATIINCPDTIGGACRWEGDHYFIEKIKKHAKLVKEQFPSHQITWGIHCHNDFGLALDNTLQAVYDGPVEQIEGCFNGIGERAGNVALEQCIMCIKHFGRYVRDGIFTNIKTEKIKEISDFISHNMLPRQPHWPISGDNAARHSSGGHTNAIIRNPLAYQPFYPDEVGHSISFIFGPLSGSNHAKSIIEERGFICKNDEKQEVSSYIKDYYQERRKGITEDELMVAYFHYRQPITIRSFDYEKNNKSVSLILHGDFFDEKEVTHIEDIGDNSALAALHKKILKYLPELKIKNYSSEALSEGITAVSRSHIIVEFNGQQYNGDGDDQDIEVSALKALIAASNIAYIYTHYKRK